MNPQSTRRLSPKKLLLSKWTAANPQSKEKHFLVTRVIGAEPHSAPIKSIELEAVLTRRVYTLPWRALNDSSQWLQGWQ
ncbi:MAG: TIGR02450 family Trp-rich protein [Propionivibrio sp.]|uniref:TIGR02450 family Trp-rich protein n=1 Tax=Candidatus Propionivibrio dominans TaxID=2954373 RepID=A0A9D7F6G1_9RHOO|nr:TIGR02450 family Trp-rich protein [Candidatus Propionivibrio dominans]